MHVVIISGSRNPEGKTARCADAVVKGLAGTGATSETLFLPAMNLERCRQCNDDGWGVCRTEMRCIIGDDITGLLEKLAAADAAVFMNPVYFKDLSESLRGFLDRLRRMAYQRKEWPLRGKPALGVCYAGSGGGGAPLSCFHLETILEGAGFNVLNVIPVRRQNIEERLPLLEKAGNRLAKNPNPGSLGVRLAKLARWTVNVATYVVYYRLGGLR